MPKETRLNRTCRRICDLLNFLRWTLHKFLQCVIIESSGSLACVARGIRERASGGAGFGGNSWAAKPRVKFNSALHQSSRGFATRIHGLATKTKALVREIPPVMQASGSQILNTKKVGFAEQFLTFAHFTNRFPKKTRSILNKHLPNFTEFFRRKRARNFFLSIFLLLCLCWRQKIS